MKPKIDLQKASKAEKIFFSLGNAGVQLISIFVMSYITMYYTNNVGIAATAAGTVMLLAKFADGISDLFFAWVMERVHFKMGKARPWLLISGPLLGGAVILCFNIPAGLSDGGKVVYALLTYTFMQAVSVTVFWLAYQTLFPLISHDPQDRNVIQSISNLLANAAGMVITLAMPFAFMVWGGVSENGAWSNVSICIAIISTVLVIISALVCKEKDTSDLDYEIETVSSEKELTTMQLVNMVFSQKQTWLVVIMFIVVNIFTYLSGLRTYMTMYLLGDYDLAIYSRSAVAATVLSMVVSMVVPLFMKKMGRRNAIIIGIILSCIGYIGLFAFGRSATGYFAFNLIATAATVPMQVATFTYVADLTDATNKKFKVNVASFCAVTGSFGGKLGSGIGSALVGWMLGWVGFSAVEQMTEATLTGILGVGTLVPIVFLVIILIIILMLEKITKKTAADLGLETT